ncbi:5-deoxy-glucuronate isomerase [Hoeflea prorocentri]|uniref:5-deoxy-glucuronate isomerase n=1 Tax=Hoeflea prorocentri TaxID=1922333 RepID=A0A9X3UFF9_9HYPH|nr:5-deoxy-glucuronate isomerase [Hoeflea prorocentri]MCY6379736.1 5-deoxy-glucuronate isomerase [Hoeflea prorocentri]MDA5397536.1 5-deoxy-glucuronate isomerase [Hoeflea prorocentri]
MWTKESLHICPDPGKSSGKLISIAPAEGMLEYLGFDVHLLKQGEELHSTNDTTETCIVLISGKIGFACDGVPVGQTDYRASPFDRRPWAFYASCKSSWRVTAEADSEIAVCSAPAQNQRKPFMVKPDDVAVETRGTGSNVRHVIDLMPAEKDIADRLLVLEAITPEGNSSSYPPHKHDKDNLPEESRLEETYYYHIEPDSGFAFQRVYNASGDLDVAMTPGDGDLIIVPEGYHPVCAPHGCELYYLNAMAGPKRVWKTTVHPDFLWLST